MDLVQQHILLMNIRSFRHLLMQELVNKMGERCGAGYKGFDKRNQSITDLMLSVDQGGGSFSD